MLNKYTSVMQDVNSILSQFEKTQLWEMRGRRRRTWGQEHIGEQAKPPATYCDQGQPIQEGCEQGFWLLMMFYGL